MCCFREKGKLSDVLKSKNEENEAYLSEIEVGLFILKLLDLISSLQGKTMFIGYSTSIIF